MEKKLGLGILLLFLSTYTFGQLEFGLKGGINLANVKTVDIPNQGEAEFNSITGFNFGIFSQLDFNEKLHLNSDFLFTSRGYEIYGYKTTIQYLEIPVLVSYSIVENLEIELGPDFGFKISEKSDQSGIDFETFDFGATIGLRYNLTEKLFLSVRYYYGLTSIAVLYGSYPVNGPASESKTFNRVLQFSLGYTLK